MSSTAPSLFPGAGSALAPYQSVSAAIAASSMWVTKRGSA